MTSANGNRAHVAKSFPLCVASVFVVPLATLLKIALTLLLVLIVVKLWPVILMLIIAVLIAVMLDPVALWLEHRGARPGLAVGLITTFMFGVLLFFLMYVLPAVS